MAIEFVQERKTERVLDALRYLSSPKALVIRDSEENKVPSREVVRGDLIELSEGYRVPADGAVLLSTNLAANESLLIGESVPVGKNVWNNKQLLSRPGGDNLPFVFSGTLITRVRVTLWCGRWACRRRWGKSASLFDLWGRNKLYSKRRFHRL